MPARVGGQHRHPARVHLQLLARLAVDDGQRHLRTTEAQLARREAMQRRIRDRHALALKQAPNFRQPHAVTEVSRDEAALLLAAAPRLAVLVRHRRADAERPQDRGEPLVGQRRLARAGGHRARLGGPRVATHRLRIEPEPGGDPFLAHPGQPLPEHLLDLDHRHLAERHRCLRAPRPARYTKRVVRAITQGGNVVGS